MFLSESVRCEQPLEKVIFFWDEYVLEKIEM